MRSNIFNSSFLWMSILCLIGGFVSAQADNKPQNPKPPSPLPMEGVTPPKIQASGLEYYPNPGVVEIVEPGNFSRVVAVAGPKGMYKSFFELLVGTKLVSPGGMWTGGKSLLVITGNIIGSGPESIRALDFLVLLQQQAQKAGGRIVAILGEEEARLLASPKEYQNKSLENEMKEKHLSLSDVVATGVASGVVTRGMFLRSMPVAAKIGRWLFAHSGYYPNVILPQFQYLTSAFMSRGVYTHPFILGRDSIVTAQWILDGKKKSLLYQRLIYNSILGIVFGNQYNSFGAPNEIGVLEGRFVRVNVGMGYDEGRSAGRLLVFIKPKQMEYNRIPELYSMAPNGSLSPLN